MSSTILIKEIWVDSHSMCLLIKDEKPVVECQNCLFGHIWILCQHFNCLTNPSYIKQFAEIANFLWKGQQFQFIESIEDYQNFYLQQIELEKTCPSDVFVYRLTDYQIFDVSVMHEPSLEDQKLQFFVYQTTSGLPYRVVCPFPYIAPSTLVHYQILPIKINERNQHKS